MTLVEPNSTEEAESELIASEVRGRDSEKSEIKQKSRPRWNKK